MPKEENKSGGKNCCIPAVKYGAPKKKCQCVTIEGAIEIAGPIEISNFPDQIDVVKSHYCNADTDTHFECIKIFINGVLDSEELTDTGIPCEDPLPDTPDVEKIQYCNPDTNTLWVKVCKYTTTPEGDTTEEILSETDLGIDCSTTQFQIVRECRDDFINLVTYAIDSDGVKTEIEATPTDEECNEIDYEYVIRKSCIDGTEHEQLVQIDNASNTEVNIGVPVNTLIPCGIQDIITNDVEYVCNKDTGLIDEIVNTYTNGILDAASPVITPTGISCEEIDDSRDYEQVRICDSITGTIHIVTTVFTQDDVAIQIGNFDTGEVCTPPEKQKVEVDTCNGIDSALVDYEVSIKGVPTVKICPEDKIEIDVEYFCDADSDFIQESVTTTTNGTPVTVVTPTTIRCEDLDLSKDFEESILCDTQTKTKHIVTTAYMQDESLTVIGDVDTQEPCCQGTPECVESQEWTYGIDNTGTRFDEDNTIRVTLSDGSFFEFFQPATTNWTPQMQIWGDEIQAAADANGIAWFVETRFRNPSNPSDLSGGGGFAGPPSVAVSNNLTNMAWRYVNIQICPGQPVPVSAEIIDSSNPARIGFNLTSDGAVLGPIQKFIICRCCGEEPVWYLEDGVTLAEAGQIPNCFEPCGTLALASSPPDRDCSFETQIGCDNNNSNLTTDFTPNITRRAQICNGEQITVDYFQEDPTDPTALISYTIVGQFVDCATGEPVPLPEAPCSEYITIQCPDYQIYPKPITDSGRDITSEENDLFPSGGIGQARNFAPWLPQYINTPPFPISGFTDMAPATAIADGFNPGAQNIFRTRVFPFGIDDNDVPRCTDGTVPNDVTLNLELNITGNHTTPGVGDDIFIYILDGASNSPVLLDTLALVGTPLIGPNIYSLSTTVSANSLNDLRFALSLQTLESNTEVFNWDIDVLEVGVTIPGCEQECVRLVHDECASNQRKSANDLLYQIAQNTRPAPQEALPPCTDFEIVKLYKLEANGDEGFRNREWHDTAPTSNIFDDVEIATENGRNFRENHDFSVPTTVDSIQDNFTLNDTDNTAGELDIQVKEGYVIVSQSMLLRYGGASEGYWAVELGECCGELELLNESGGFSPTRTMDFTIPKGIHQLRLWNIDSGGSNSSANLSYSLDGGITWIVDNTPPNIDVYTGKPNEMCENIKVCKDTGEFIGLLDGNLKDSTEYYDCPQACTKSNCLTC